MIQASIVSIGNELLSGHTVDTNASYLSRQLLTIGIPVVAGHTVGDDLSAIKRALHMACSDADIVVVTGGLGPTDDDLTRQAVAEFKTFCKESRNSLPAAMSLCRQGTESRRSSPPGQTLLTMSLAPRRVLPQNATATICSFYPASHPK
jgi:molybdenum cofactor synthesis domain-containing protein